MMTRDQFEAHVMEQAMEKHPDPGIEYEGEHWYELVMDNKKMQREAYIERAMEHEWKLVEALQRLRAMAIQRLNHSSPAHIYDIPLDLAIIDADTALSPYTTKPVEP